VTSLQKQYNLMKQRQKQAAVILQNAYAKGAEKLNDVVGNSPSSEEVVFNHLYVGKTSQINRINNTHMMNGSIPLASKVVQPQNRQRNLQGSSKVAGARNSERRNSERRRRSDSASEHQIAVETNTITQLRRCRSFDVSSLYVEELVVVDRRSKSCVELRNWFPVIRKISSRVPSLSSSSSSAASAPISPAHDSPHVPNFYLFSPVPEALKKEKKNPMLIKSKQILNSLPSSESVPPPNFYPFPIRHQSKLIERGKQWGLYG